MALLLHSFPLGFTDNEVETAGEVMWNLYIWYIVRDKDLWVSRSLIVSPHHAS